MHIQVACVIIVVISFASMYLLTFPFRYGPSTQAEEPFPPSVSPSKTPVNIDSLHPPPDPNPSPQKIAGSHSSENFCESYSSSVEVTGGAPGEAFALLFTAPEAEEVVGDPRGDRIHLGSVGPDGYKYFTICIAKHEHYHKVKLSLTLVYTEGKKIEGDADLYISNTIQYPTATDSTWISRDNGDDTITLPTYQSEFKESNTLFVGVRGRPGNEEDVNFKLEVDILDMSKFEVLRKSSLRGGKRTMPRDVKSVDGYTIF